MILKVNSRYLSRDFPVEVTEEAHIIFFYFLKTVRALSVSDKTIALSSGELIGKF